MRRNKYLRRILVYKLSQAHDVEFVCFSLIFYFLKGGKTYPSFFEVMKNGYNQNKKEHSSPVLEETE